MFSLFNKNVFACAVLFAVCLPVNAAGLSDAINDYQRVNSQGKASTELLIDNDSLLLNRDDGFYTSGLQVTRRYILREGQSAYVAGWRIGQQIYTASDINLPPASVRPPNHPYAGWLYGGWFKENYHNNGAHLSYGLDIGCLGPCSGARWTQTNLHRLLDQPLPQGWSKQVKNEIGAVLYGEIAPVHWMMGDSVDVTPFIHGRFGNIYTDIGAGATLQVGRLPAQALGDRLNAFLRTDVRAVGYNASLQGGYFSSNNPHTVDPKRLVGEAELGLKWRSGQYAFTGSVIRRSTEIAALSNARGAETFVRLVFIYTP